MFVYAARGAVDTIALSRRLPMGSGRERIKGICMQKWRLLATWTIACCVSCFAGGLSAESFPATVTAGTDRQRATSPALTQPSQPSQIQRLATFTGRGVVSNSIVGPGPTPGSERLYEAYIYHGEAFHLVSIDPATGAHQVFKSPVESEEECIGLVSGPDGRIYLGTSGNAHLFQFDPSSGILADLGIPLPKEVVINDLVVASDGKLYGCTTPSAKLFRYDFASGQFEDLGRMDPTGTYGRFIAASDDGFVYIGIGFEQAHLVAYEIATGRHEDILPDGHRQREKLAFVHRADNGGVYARVGDSHFSVNGWSAKPISRDQWRNGPRLRLANGQFVATDSKSIRCTTPAGELATVRPFTYSGGQLGVFRLVLGNDGMIYLSTRGPANFYRVDPVTGQYTHFGTIGRGEASAFLPYGDRLLIGGYCSWSPLLVYTPGDPFVLKRNPKLVEDPCLNLGWVPRAMVLGADGRVYIAAEPGYGVRYQPLLAWDVDAGTFRQCDTGGQSVVSLAVAGDRLICGTTTDTGISGQPTHEDASVFVWDTSTQRVVSRSVPVAGAKSITNLVALPEGKVWGVANQTAFLLDLETGEVIHRTKFYDYVYNSACLGPDGQVWALNNGGIFTFNPSDGKLRQVVRTPIPITAGFACDGKALWFTCRSTLYRYNFPW